MGGDLHHAAGVAGRADPAALAGKGDQTLGAALSAAGAGEPVVHNAAAQIGAEVARSPPGDGIPTGTGAGDLGEEALEMMLNDRVQRGGGGVAATVDGGGAGGRHGLRGGGCTHGRGK
jgi:hypothetical protein